MKLEDAIANVLKERKIMDIFEAIDAIKKHSKSRQNDDFIANAIEEYLLETGATDISIDYENEVLVYREQLFANTSFRIQLTSEEIAAKELIIGHRFMPFIHPRIHPKSIFLIDEADNEIELFTDKRSFEENIIYFSLLPPYGLQHYDLDNEGNIPALVYDLSDWMRRNEFTSKDNLLLSPIDYQKNIFRLEKISGKEINRQKIVNTQIDEALENAILNEIVSSEVILPIDMQLFKAIGTLEKRFQQKLGTPIGPLLSAHEEIQIYNSGSYAYLNTADNMDMTMDMAMDEAMNPDLGAMGTATDIPGIFTEMGISYTEEFIIGKMIEQIHIQNKIDSDELYQFLFKNGAQSFYNEKQHENFDKAFAKLAKKIEKDWKTQRLSPSAQQLLSQTLKLKTEIIGLLREIDAKLTDPANFDFSMLMQLQPFEHLSDGLLNLLISDQEKPESSIVNMNKQVKHMRKEFAEASAFILENLG